MNANGDIYINWGPADEAGSEIRESNSSKNRAE